MKCSEIIITLKYKNDFVECHYRPWYLPMTYLTHFFGNTTQIKRVKDYEKK